jgi:hypothetical protein
MQAHREYVRTEQRRYASAEDYYEDHPALDSDAPEMKHGEVTVGNCGLTNDEFMQAIADMEAAGGWDKCTARQTGRAA